MSTWFTSDQHFGHRMIIKYERRHENIAALTPDDPDIAIMDNFMIAQWNENIQPHDTVYHLGDFALGKKPYRESIVKRLHGHKIIILGNHDAGAKSMLGIGFQEAYRYLGLEVPTYDGHTNWLLVHSAHPFFEHKSWYDHIICGHVHSNWQTKERAFNVGVDVNKYKPWRLDKLAWELGYTVASDATPHVILTPKQTGVSAMKEILKGNLT